MKHLQRPLIIIIFLLSIFSISSMGQSATITGTIIDENSEPAIGCSVMLKGKTSGAITDIDGNFTLQADPGDILVISYIGYKSQEIKIEPGKKHYTITLQSDEYRLEESIVIGYGTVSSSSKSNTISLAKSSYDHLSEEEYTAFGENKFKSPLKEPLSTFSADVDAASYTNMRRFLNEGLFPPRDAIRTEELINFFKYNYKQPTDKEPVAISTETGACPWNPSHFLFSIGIKTCDLLKKELPAANFVFLIDVSGSMSGPTRLDLVKSSLNMLVENLRPADKVAIVVYAGSAGVVLPSTSGKNKKKIKTALENLEAGGSTAGGEGILLAYKIAKENLIKNGNNRIILCTDGDFNVGPSSEKQLEMLIEEQRKSGVFLSVLGYGMGNYKDNRMQILAQKGNGNHAYIDDISEAKRVLVNETGTLYTVAKDVKLQVEFNPAKVQAYRLIGYETRLLDDKDFNDDTKDAGEMGAGHTVTALYEIIPADIDPSFEIIRPEEKTDPAIRTYSDELLTVKLRYKLPDKEESKQISVPVVFNINNQPDENFRFASSVAMFAQLLRNSGFIGNTTYDDVIRLAKSAMGEDKDGFRKEFVQLVEKAKELTNSDKPLLYGNIHIDEDLFEYFDEESDNNTFYGIKDKKGNIIIQPVYDDIEYINGGVFLVSKNNKYGLYHYSSGEITPVIYDDIEKLNDLAFVVEKDDLKGLLDYYGREILPPLYNDVTEVYYGYYSPEKDDKKGMIDHTGQLIIPLEYDEIDIYYKYIIVEKDNKKSIFDRNGKLIIPEGYDDIDFSRELLIVEKNDLYGAYNAEGKKVIPVVYDYIGDRGEWLELEKNDKYGIAARNGKKRTKTKFENVDELKSGLLEVERKDKYGLVNAKGKKLTPIKYERISRLENELYLLEKNNDKYGLFNADINKTVLRDKYDDIELAYESDLFTNKDGSSGLLIVTRENKNEDNKYGLFTTGGKQILPVVYDDITEVDLEDQNYNTEDLFFRIEQNDKYGLTDKTGKIILPVKYHYIETSFDNGILEAEENEKSVYFDRNGKPAANPNEMLQE